MIPLIIEADLYFSIIWSGDFIFAVIVTLVKFFDDESLDLKSASISLKIFFNTEISSKSVFKINLNL